MKKSNMILFTILSFCFVLGGSITTFAQDNTDNSIITDEQVSEVKTEFMNYGVTESVADDLIEKLKSGKLLDSMIYTEDKAINHEVRVNKATGEEAEVYLFEDGSFISMEVEDVVDFSEPGITPYFGVKVSGGSCKSTAKAYNCTKKKVSYGTGVWKMQFLADYSIVNGGRDTINKIYGESISGAVNSSGERFRYIRKTETSSKKAHARYSAKLSYAGYAQQVRSISLYVGKNKASAKGYTHY